jgi:glutaredoxin
MTARLTLYSRGDCCLCEEMKETIRQVAAKIPLEMEEIDVDGSVELREDFGAEVPVLFINGRKAFKYRVSAKELARRLGGGTFWRRWGSVTKGA